MVVNVMVVESISCFVTMSSSANTWCAAREAWPERQPTHRNLNRIWKNEKFKLFGFV